MQRTPHRCPHCEQPLHISRDMWGAYYLCEDCGWTAEDDDEVLLGRALPPPALTSLMPGAAGPNPGQRLEAP